MKINIFNDDPFDIEQIDPVWFDDLEDYLDFCKNQYFNACKDARILEIGARHGAHSKKIRQQQPSQLTVIEGDRAAAEQLQQTRIVDKVIVDDVMMALKDKHSFDVVICLGVLYHLHSPIHLLELIVNNCGPVVIILDCVMAPDVLQFDNELTNYPGNNQTRSDWCGASVKLVAPFLTYLQCMDNLGYELHQVHRIQVKNYFSKSNSWMASWRRKNDNS